MIAVAYALLGCAALGFGYRLAVGPSLVDRLLASNGLVLVGMGAIALLAMQTGDGAFLPALIALALVGPVGSAMVARFIERRGR